MEDREIVKEVSDIIHSDEEDVVNSIKKFKREIKEMEESLEKI
ncbi:MAG: hypothetical protein ABEK36_01755 [Candidatus Aenigmatarchaeota archaeon]